MNKAFILISIILLLVFVSNFFIIKLNSSNKFFLGIDALNHIDSLKNYKQNYAPLTLLFFHAFINPNNTQTFYFMHVFFLFLAIPFLVWLQNNKSFFSILVYYSSYFVWMSDNNGSLPQTIIILFFLLMSLTKNNFYRLLLVFIGFGLHFSGWIFLVAWFLIQNLHEKPGILFLGVCEKPLSAGVWKFTVLKEKVVTGISSIDFSTISNLFSRILFLPLWYFALKGLFSKKNRPHLLILGFILLTGIFYGFGDSPEVQALVNIRILVLAIFPIIAGLNTSWEKASKNTRLLILLSVLAQFLFNFVSWIERKNILYCDLVVNDAINYKSKVY